mgnify:CR=1 FL=1
MLSLLFVIFEKVKYLTLNNEDQINRIFHCRRLRL